MAAASEMTSLRSPRLPRALTEPATIGICGPSGRVDEGALAQSVAYLEDLGHTVVMPGETVHEWRYFAGSDDERLAGLHRLIDDPKVQMVMAARGGYGLTRLLHRIDWNRVAASGKIYVGFSDFTAFNLAALANANLVTFHGPLVAVDFGRKDLDSFTQQHFWMAVSRSSHRLDDVECEHGYDPRRVDGTLWGGNLSLLAAATSRCSRTSSARRISPRSMAASSMSRKWAKNPMRSSACSFSSTTPACWAGSGRSCSATSTTACRPTRSGIPTRWTR
jgi:muramoyltetrapeptide carboxypeptidase LdcA involved in peptidoglycan recycling